MIKHVMTAEALQEIGRSGVERMRRWLDCTTRFAISHSAYDLDPTGKPYGQVRVELLDGSVENFDLVGDVLGEDTRPGNTVYIECKTYSGDGGQGGQYHEYLAVAYSAVARYRKVHGGPPSWDFMWLTTHPFLVTSFSQLTKEPAIAAACAEDKHGARLGGEPYDPELGGLLASRLWMCVVNDRMLNEMSMGTALRVLVAGAMTQLRETAA